MRVERARRAASTVSRKISFASFVNSALCQSKNTPIILDAGVSAVRSTAVAAQSTVATARKNLFELDMLAPNSLMGRSTLTPDRHIAPSATFTQNADQLTKSIRKRRILRKNVVNL
jgi:hypothetical protein